MITISNEFLTATFSKIGAELKSLKSSDREYIWNGDPAFWTGSSPVLFPICSGLKDDEFIYEGKTYSMPKHGFARRSEFEVESVSKNTATFLLSSANCPRDNYPFEYEFRIIYTLEGKKLNVEYNIRNLTDGDMYFSVGAHEAYSCPEGIENYEVVFDKAETLAAYQLDGALLSDRTEIIAKDCKSISLDVLFADNDCPILKNLNSRKVTLRNKLTDEKIEVNFEGFDYLLFWTVPGSTFACIEPWCGITDNVNTTKDFTQKEGIEKIEKGGFFYRLHSFEII